ncbi:DUF6647 family protein [Yoonia sediminilitoris]|uniref:DUF6647 domain-containing protein n=1 Tax=Yoonia sediminilitoris TaxID=1286148 RepID=A0A2T6K162_9RHOB|nr:DUF6647 family protein [Yoonia sediminilitoris]PUB08379.1 hypothetical protein C8N45_1357 [Yoonia sediminilitoris]RCW89435.1 hypothetical protein DFP92_1357 [Yoonia sediminilitoris]
MLERSPACLWLVALIMFAGSAWADAIVRLDREPAWRKTENIAELVEVFDTWLDQNTDFLRPETRPKIEIISASLTATIQGSSASRFGRTRGLFDPESSTIYMIMPWDQKDPHDASVLLHELVHARQVSRHYYCPGAQEEAAYRLQDEWLRERGLQAKVNWIAVVLEAGCSRRDFHPD